MTTLRIEEMVEEFERLFQVERSRLEDRIREALTQAHQAGIDEAVEKMEDLFSEKAKYNEDFVDNGYGEPINTSYWTIYEGDWEKIIKALQDKQK